MCLLNCSKMYTGTQNCFDKVFSNFDYKYFEMNVTHNDLSTAADANVQNEIPPVNVLHTKLQQKISRTQFLTTVK